MTDTVLPAEVLAELLRKAHAVVIWTDQDTIRRDAAGATPLIEARRTYLRARVEALAAVRPLTIWDCGGCTCNPRDPDPESCLYHYVAALQPDNHHIPWNCPTFYNGCNCSTDAP